nr:MAG TPA: regulatory protein [Caudoviricetes sp.]
MTDIILSTQNGEPVASSRQIAESFEKNHRDVLKAIEGLEVGLRKTSQTPMFYKTEYIHEQNGQTYPMYMMNRDGFMLLVMGFNNSEKAFEWKLKYIAAFNAMEGKTHDIKA